MSLPSADPSHVKSDVTSGVTGQAGCSGVRRGGYTMVSGSRQELGPQQLKSTFEARWTLTPGPRQHRLCLNPGADAACSQTNLGVAEVGTRVVSE